MHEAITDPTKKFILVPDLGSDLVRIYAIKAGTTAVTPLTPIPAVKGSGPRHAGFSVQGKNTYFYTVNEISNTITGYTVQYNGDAAPTFTQILHFSTHGPGGSVPAGTKAAELVVSVSSFHGLLLLP